MKNIVMLWMFLFSFYGMAQKLSEKDIEKLQVFDIHTEKLNLNDLKIQKDLYGILVLDSKRIKNKRTGLILTSFSVLTTTFGIVALTHDKADDGTGRAIQETMGGVALGLGVTSAGISIPLFIASKKKKRERDSRIIQFNSH